MNDKLNAGRFEWISIRGRFVYGYLCLINAMAHSKSFPLPTQLGLLFHEFVSSTELGEWHTKVEDILPSFIMDADEPANKYFTSDEVEGIKDYYKQQPAFIIDIIEDLFWLGISNLYVGFDSENSLRYLKEILQHMEKHSVALPEIEKVRKCSIFDERGWGKQDDLDDYK